MPDNEIRARTAVCFLGEDGIIRIIVDQGAEEKLADAQDNMRATIALSGGRRRPILVDIRGMKAQDREARIYYAGPDAAQNSTAVALLAGSRVSTIIANFFIALSKSIVPTRLFTVEDEALEWLKGYIQ